MNVSSLPAGIRGLLSRSTKETLQEEKASLPGSVLLLFLLPQCSQQMSSQGCVPAPPQVVLCLLALLVAPQ